MFLYIFNKVDFNPNEKIDIIYLLIKKCNFNFNRLDVLCKNEKEIEDTNKVPLKFKKSIQSDLEDLKENITSLLIEKIKETNEWYDSNTTINKDINSNQDIIIVKEIAKILDWNYLNNTFKNKLDINHAYWELLYPKDINKELSEFTEEKAKNKAFAEIYQKELAQLFQSRKELLYNEYLSILIKHDFINTDLFEFTKEHVPNDFQKDDFDAFKKLFNWIGFIADLQSKNIIIKNKKELLLHLINGEYTENEILKKEKQDVPTVSSSYFKARDEEMRDIIYFLSDFFYNYQQENKNSSIASIEELFEYYHDNPTLAAKIESSSREDEAYRNGILSLFFMVLDKDNFLYLQNIFETAFEKNKNYPNYFFGTVTYSAFLQKIIKLDCIKKFYHSNNNNIINNFLLYCVEKRENFVLNNTIIEELKSYLEKEKKNIILNYKAKSEEFHRIPGSWFDHNDINNIDCNFLTNDQLKALGIFAVNALSKTQIEALIKDEKLNFISAAAISIDFIKNIEDIIKLTDKQLEALDIFAVHALSKKQIEALIHHNKLNFISGKAIGKNFIKNIEEDIIKLTDKQLEALEKVAVSALSETQIKALIDDKKLNFISGEAIGENFIKIIKNIEKYNIKLTEEQLKALDKFAVSALSETQIKALIKDKKLHLISAEAIGENFIKNIEEDIIKLTDEQLKAFGYSQTKALSKKQIYKLIQHDKLNLIKNDYWNIFDLIIIHIQKKLKWIAIISLLFISYYSCKYFLQKNSDDIKIQEGKRNK